MSYDPTTKPVIHIPLTVTLEELQLLYQAVEKYRKPGFAESLAYLYMLLRNALRKYDPEWRRQDD